MSGDPQGEDLYDEFGNYIGPDLDESSSDDESSGDESSEASSSDGGPGEGDAEPDEAASDVSDMDAPGVGGGGGAMVPRDEMEGDEHDGPGAPSSSIVLHEDKVHYPSAEEVYGRDVKTAVLDEDAMELEEPIVAPVRKKDFSLMRDEDDAAERMGVAAGGGGGGGGEDELVSDEYLTALLSNETTRTRRGFALMGHLHHGKTTFVDLLVEQTLAKPDAFGPRASMEAHSGNVGEGVNSKGANSGGGPRVTDTLRSEQERQVSVKSCPIVLPLPDSRGKTYALTMVDCPGHTDFHDETVASLKAVDGAVLAVDAVEGIMMSTTMAASAAISEGLPLCLLVTKVDRLIVELKLPPDDAYYKLRRIVEEVNMLIRQKSNGRYPPLSPERGNVAFSSGMHGWSFTLGSIAERYVEHCRSSSEREALAEEDERGGGGDDGYGYSDDEDDYGYGGGGGGNGGGMSGTPLGRNLTPADLARRLWGDCYLDPAAGTFHRSSRDCDNSEGPVKRTFVQYALEPLYKIYAACLGENERDVDKMLRTVGVILGRDQLRASARPLLRAALRRFFGDGSGGFVDMVAKHIPSPAAASKGKVARCYTGPLTSPVASSMSTCSPTGPLMFHVTKLYAAPDGKSFSSFGRIYSGTVKPGDRVRVLGEGYDPDVDDEDCATATVSGVRVPRGRRNVEVTRAVAGNWVLLEGVDANIVKTATITSLGSSMDDMGARNNDDDSARIFAPLKFPNVGHESTLKLAVEPLHPSDLPKMVEGLRRVSKSYPLARTRVEESGEHVLFGTGELYLDCAMSDLRTVYSDVEVKVADPVVGFRETVAETSGIKCFAETANKRNRLTVIAEPLDEGLAEKLECGKVKLDKWDKKKVGRYFQSQFDWDLLSARSVWAFGPSPSDGTNVLLDDTLPSEVDKSLLGSCRGGIVQGFQWATREGPLCEEPVRSTKIKILDATLADKPIHRGGGQIIPAARRAVHSGLLTATPRLLEPWYRFQIQCVPELVGEMESLLKKRRGHVTGDRPIPGTTLSLVHGYLPVLDGFGFETDVRCLTQGQAFAHTVFDHWGVVPGDPLDSSVVLHPLEPSPPHCLAREFLVKTRRRKGLSEDVTVSKFFDEGMRAQLEAEEGDGLDDNLSVG